MVYRHRQIGTLVLVVLGAGTLMTLALLVFVVPGPGTIVAGLVAMLLLACCALFWSLTVEVSMDGVALWLGIGLIRRRFPAHDLRDARIVRNPWYYGWGIHLTPDGWLFNVSGLDAVELEFQGNRKFRIGTDEPQQLLTAIRQVIRRTD